MLFSSPWHSSSKGKGKGTARERLKTREQVPGPAPRVERANDLEGLVSADHCGDALGVLFEAKAQRGGREDKGQGK